MTELVECFTLPFPPTWGDFISPESWSQRMVVAQRPPLHSQSYFPLTFSLRYIGTSSATSTSASTNGKGPILPRKVSKSLDRKIGQQVDGMTVDHPTKPEDAARLNGVVKKEVVVGEGPRRAKRKARKPAIKDESSDDSDTPLVSLFLLISKDRLEGLGRSRSRAVVHIHLRGALLTHYNSRRNAVEQAMVSRLSLSSSHLMTTSPWLRKLHRRTVNSLRPKPPSKTRNLLPL